MTKVGYVGYSKDLQHPADRRRIASWADESEIELEITNPIESEVLILSNSANFSYWMKRAHQPIVLDLVDGYLGEYPSFVKDFLRNILRTLRGTSSFRWLTYTKHLQWACEHSDAVIVAGHEQRNEVLKYNSNVHVILDNFSEFDVPKIKEPGSRMNHQDPTSEKRIFWEGFGYTLKHFRILARELDSFLSENDFQMSLVTVLNFPRWGGYLGNVKTQSVVQELFPLSWQRIEIVPWSIENILKHTEISRFAIIPIDKRDKFASLKSENKLLSMWYLGIPTLFSNIPSYSRAAIACGESAFCIPNEDWADGLIRINLKTLANSRISTEVLAYIQESHTKKVLSDRWSAAIASCMSPEKFSRGK